MKPNTYDILDPNILSSAINEIIQVEACIASNYILPILIHRNYSVQILKEKVIQRCYEQYGYPNLKILALRDHNQNDIPTEGRIYHFLNHGDKFFVLLSPECHPNLSTIHSNKLYKLQKIDEYDPFEPISNAFQEFFFVREGLLRPNCFNKLQEEIESRQQFLDCTGDIDTEEYTQVIAIIRVLAPLLYNKKSQAQLFISILESLPTTLKSVVPRMIRSLCIDLLNNLSRIESGFSN